MDLKKDKVCIFHVDILKYGKHFIAILCSYFYKIHSVLQ